MQPKSLPYTPLNNKIKPFFFANLLHLFKNEKVVLCFYFITVFSHPLLLLLLLLCSHAIRCHHLQLSFAIDQWLHISCCNWKDHFRRPGTQRLTDCVLNKMLEQKEARRYQGASFYTFFISTCVKCPPVQPWTLLIILLQLVCTRIRCSLH